MPRDIRHREQPDPTRTLTRSLAIEGFERVRAGEEGQPDRYEFKLASDAPVEIWRDEFETLGMNPGEVRMDWIGSGNAPLLWVHDRSEQLGVVESSRVDGGFLFVTVRFGNGQFAQEKKRDWEDGILKNVSVGYRVHNWKHERHEDGKDYYRVTDWEPLEATLCPIPADRSVGAGRSYKERGEPALSEGEKSKRAMPQTAKPPKTPETSDEPRINVSEVREQARRDERERQAKIRKAAEGIKGYDLSDVASRAIDEGLGVEQFTVAPVLRWLGEFTMRD